MKDVLMPNKKSKKPAKYFYAKMPKKVGKKTLETFGFK